MVSLKQARELPARNRQTNGQKNMRSIYIAIAIVAAIALITGIVIIKRKTTAIWTDSSSCDGFTMVMNRDSMYNFISDDGNRYTFFYNYSDCMPFSEGYTFVKVGSADMWSMIDTKGNSIGELKFVDVKPFKNGYAWVRTEDGSANLIGTDCKLKLPQGKYSDVSQEVSDGVLVVQGQDGLYGYATVEGNELIKPAFAYAEPFKHGLAPVKRGSQMTIINLNGEQLCPAVFAGFVITEDAVFPYIEEFEDKYGNWSNRKLYGLMTKEGEWLLPCCFSDYNEPSEGTVLMVSQDSPTDTRFYRYFSMSNGNELFNKVFNSASSFRDGKARVEYFGSVYDIDLKGSILIDENVKWLLGTWCTQIDAVGYSKITFGTGGKVSMAYYFGYSDYPYGSTSGTYTVDDVSVSLNLNDGSEYCRVISPTSMAMGNYRLIKIAELKVPGNMYMNEYTYNDEMYRANPLVRNVSQWYMGQWADRDGDKVVITEDELIFMEKGRPAERTELTVSGSTVSATIRGYGGFTLVQSSMLLRAKIYSGDGRLKYSKTMFFDGNGTYVPSDIQSDDQEPDLEASEASEEGRESRYTISDMYNICSDRLLTDEDIKHFTKKELRIIRNQIYAKYGYIFKSQDLQEYFKQQDWYSPKYTDVSSRLTETELANVAFIKARE